MAHSRRLLGGQPPKLGTQLILCLAVFGPLPEVLGGGWEAFFWLAAFALLLVAAAFYEGAAKQGRNESQ